MAFTATMNAFLTTLVNKFALQEVRTKTYNNHLAVFKKERIPYGFDAEFTHVNPTDLTDYTAPNYAQHKYTDPYATHVPDLKTEYLKVVENKKSAVTIVEDTILDAMTSYEKFDMLAQSIINSLYSGNAIWEEGKIKDLMGGAITGGKTVAKTITPVTDAATSAAALKQILDIIDSMQWASNANCAKTGVITFTDPENARVIMRYDFWNALKVYSYSTSFHDDFIRIEPRLTLVDTFTNEGTAMPDTYALICDEAFVQFRDRTFEVNSIVNPADLFINYWMRHRALAGIIECANAVSIGKAAGNT